MFFLMKEDFASAGDGPAPSQPLAPQEVSDSARMRGALAACDSMLATCARVSVSDTATFGARMMAVATGAKLAAASALAASAIARLEEAQTHRQLAAAKIEVTRASRNASARRAERRVSSARNASGYGPDDWRAYSDDDEESTNNPNENEWPE
jgi:hypothetical protein